MVKSKHFILFFLIIIIALSFASIYFSINSGYLAARTFDVSFIVREDVLGFDVDNSSLTFGALTPGTQGRRTVIFENTHDFSIRVVPTISKNLIDVIFLNSSYFVESGGSLNVSVELRIPEDYSFGNYTGEVKFDIYKSE